ncbi:MULTISPECIES: ribonuclease III [Pseudovibrio]|uniref:ribonuclease III n=1 Tax=Stappiaceae TaxID=2821832 RepID=UPI0023672F78|nr:MULTISPECIES: ribonuclease III [Pseudovibrio]MDD7908364.1 ribonuclease III [Pseudovibrio exalbescens]MDX5592490.1 ribonuclease III [Pseudovibrio sp. SPO723]
MNARKKKVSDEALEKRIQYSFKDKSLLEKALSHASALPASDAPLKSYQRLEFLGDRVLGLSVATMLEKHFPHAEEGELARRLNQLVKKETCAEVARELKIGDHMRLGDSECQSGGRGKTALLADMCESILAAIYLDSGFEAANKFVNTHFAGRMLSYKGPLRDAKTTLQEWAQSKGRPTPIYEVVDRSGPDHAPVFNIRVTVEGVDPGEACGASKRVAEQSAAELILRREGVWNS